MERLTAALGGISGILVTPFDAADRIAPQRLAPIIERALRAGVHILVANGNTGEFYSLSTDEAVAMVEAAAQQIAGRAPLLCGIGRALPDALRLAKAARAAGADGLMIHQPPDPFAAPRGVVDYVRRVAEAGDGLPLVLYLRNDAMGTAGIADLCAVEGVVAVKWATPNPMRMAEAAAAADARIVWVAGLAETWAPVLYAAGARGFTSGLINVWPERSMEIHAALGDGDHTRANALIATMRAFEEIRAEELNGTNVTGVKAALALQGLDCGPTRPPSAWPLTASQAHRLRAFMEASGLLRVAA
jgi:4-hydroxy-tetrahydrodipicolinate synthase